MTQNHDVAVAWAQAGALVLQAVILHHVTPGEALQATIAELRDEGVCIDDPALTMPFLSSRRC